MRRLALAALLVACEPRVFGSVSVDPRDPAALSEALTIRGASRIDRSLPGTSGGGDPSIALTATTASVARGAALPLALTFAGAQPPSDLFVAVVGAEDAFTAPADTQSLGEIFVIVPSRVGVGADGVDFELELVVEDAGGRISNRVVAAVDVVSPFVPAPDGLTCQEFGGPAFPSCGGRTLRFCLREDICFYELMDARIDCDCTAAGPSDACIDRVVDACRR